MDLYADEDFALPVTAELRRLGHDVVTVQGDGRHGAADIDVLARAHQLRRAVLTYNRRHFERLHRQGIVHSGIVSCIRDDNFAALAARIHEAINGLATGRWCLRVNRKP
jgi:hypothetical protein